MMKLKIITLSFLLAIIYSCGSNKATEHSDEEEHDEGIAMCPSQAADLGLEYDTVRLKPFSAAIHTSGIIEATPGDETAIIATSSGVVNFNGQKIVEGIAVSRGASLFTINSSNFTDDNLLSRIAQSKAELRKAEADLSRVESLYKDQLATAREMEETRLAESLARQELERLTSNTVGGSKRVINPLTGYITALKVRDGDYVTQGEMLGTVSHNRMVVLKADLPARHFDKLEMIESANFITPYNNNVYDIEQLSGRKLATSRSSSSYSIPVRFEIENRAGLISGSVVEVYLKTRAKEESIVVPLSALTEEQGAHYVYIRLDVEHYEKRHVFTGLNNGVEIEIIKGLEVGESIVTKGAYFIRLAAMSGDIPHGHSH